MRMKFEMLFINMVARSAPGVFPRSRWIGVDKCLRSLGLLASMHGLSQSAFSEWAASMGTRLPSSMQAAGAEGSAAAMEDAAEDGEAADDGEAHLGAADMPDLANVAKMVSPEEYRDVLRGWRQKGLAFVSALAHRPWLLVLSAVLLAQQSLMANYLLVSGAIWDAREEGLSALAKEHGVDRCPKWRALVSSTRALEQ